MIFDSFPLLLKIQWKDRIATSSFTFGLTIQMFSLSFHLWNSNADLATRINGALSAALYVSLNISLFFSLACIRNEFRFGTIHQILLTAANLPSLIRARAFVNTLLCSLSLIPPLCILIWLDPNLLIDGTILKLYALYFAAVFSQTVAACWIVHTFKSPATDVLWLGYVYFLLGLNLIPTSFGATISRYFPSGAALEMQTSNVSPLVAMSYVALFLAWTFIPTLTLKSRVQSQITNHIVSGRQSV